MQARYYKNYGQVFCITEPLGQLSGGMWIAVLIIDYVMTKRPIVVTKILAAISILAG